MSPRKPTVDGMDDVDDEDGIAEEETAHETDLTLHEEDADKVGLNRRPPEAGDPYLTDKDEEDEA
jgi:hypothetical protein